MVSTSDEEGVIGYQVTTVQPANMQPSAQAALPSRMILPAVSFMRSTFQRTGSVNALVAYSKPAWQAPQFNSAALAFFLPNCLSKALWISAISMERRDRKSTRLNSSHLGISYAVFCLKKKTH